MMHVHSSRTYRYDASSAADDRTRDGIGSSVMCVLYFASPITPQRSALATASVALRSA